MNKILNNIFKGLLLSFVILLVGGFTYINISKGTPHTSMTLVSSSLINSINTEKKEEEVVKVDNKVDSKEVEDEKKEKETKDASLQSETKEDNNKEIEKVVEATPTPVPTPEPTPAPTPTPTPSVPSASGSYSPSTTGGDSNFVYEGYVTAYGPDCYGCYGSMTAMGDYVGEGNIYYNHPTYGTIRIVAGDKDMLNKVVRITGLNISSEPVIAIVRDTGGDIGRNKPKKIVLDLLYTSERSQEVLNFGMQWAKVEVLT